MTTEEQQIKLAEWMGWKWWNRNEINPKSSLGFGYWRSPDQTRSQDSPPDTNSLDVLHEMVQHPVAPPGTSSNPHLVLGIPWPEHHRGRQRNGWRSDLADQERAASKLFYRIVRGGIKRLVHTNKLLIMDQNPFPHVVLFQFLLHLPVCSDFVFKFRHLC